MFVFSCRKEAFAAHFRENAAPRHGEHYTGYSYPKCNYLLYSVWVITMGKRRSRESSSEPKSSVPQLRNVSSLASLVPLLRWKNHLQTWALVFGVRESPQSLDTDRCTDQDRASLQEFPKLLYRNAAPGTRTPWPLHSLLFLCYLSITWLFKR